MGGEAYLCSAPHTSGPSWGMSFLQGDMRANEQMRYWKVAWDSIRCERRALPSTLGRCPQLWFWLCAVCKPDQSLHLSGSTLFPWVPQLHSLRVLFLSDCSFYSPSSIPQTSTVSLLCARPGLDYRNTEQHVNNRF